MGKQIISALIIIFNVYFIFLFVKYYFKHKEELEIDKASSIGLPFATFLVMFLTSFGISDFATSSLIYLKLKWIDIKKLPGTLNMQFTIPGAVLSLITMRAFLIDIPTLLVCVVTQMLGGYLGPRIIVKLPERSIKIVMGVGLSISAILILFGQLGLLPIGGTLTELRGFKLVIAGIFLFIIGIMSNAGIGNFAPNTVVLYLLGLSPMVTIPLIMTSNGLFGPAISIGYVRYVKTYSHKITLYCSIFGVLGVIVGTHLLTKFDISSFSWLVIIILVYTSYIIFNSLKVKS